MIKEETLKELYLNQELTMSEISKILDVSVGSVCNYARKYGLERKKFTDKSRLKMSNSLKGRTSSRKGILLSDETKKKMSESHKGLKRNPSKYGGHRKRRQDGYIYVYVPDHPNSSKDGYVMEHILVMEEKIGRYITRNEVVHHKNKKRDDNRIDNLELMTVKAHASFHLKERWAKKKEKKNG